MLVPAWPSIGFGLGARAVRRGEAPRRSAGARSTVGIAPLLLTAWLRRGVVETRRFARRRAARRSRARAIGTSRWPARCSRSPRWCASIRGARSRSASSAVCPSAGIGVSFQFVSQFLQTERGWTPGAFAVMSVFFGAFGIIGNPAAGPLADHFGRRTVVVAVLTSFPLCTTAFYAGPAWRPSPLPWTAMVFLSMASGVMIRALTTELFPTPFRGAAGGTQALLETLGWWPGSSCIRAHGVAREPGPRASAALTRDDRRRCAVALKPETARRELEEITEEGIAP